MTSTASALGLTQSAVSAAVAALETAHAAHLFERVGRRLELSETGQLFLPAARVVLASAAVATQVLDDLSGLKRGRLRIAASQTIASYWLPPRLSIFAQAHPAVELSVAVSNSARVATALLEGAADLGFVEGAVDEPALQHRTIGADRLGLFGRAGHPLAGTRVTPLQLKQLAWAVREPGSGTRSVFDAAMRAVRLDEADVRIVLELPSNEALLAAVATGDLVTAVSELAAAPHVATGQVQRIPFDLPARNFDLLVHKDRHRSRAAAAFMARL